MKTAAKAIKFAEPAGTELREWAGERVVSQGRRYLKAVDDLRVAADGTLRARVRGTQSYNTEVSFNSGAKWISQCDCPYYWGPCKHAVAVILTYLAALKNDRIPL